MNTEPKGISLGPKRVSGLKQWHKNVFYKTVNPVITLANDYYAQRMTVLILKGRQLGTVTNTDAMMILIVNFSY